MRKLSLRKLTAKELAALEASGLSETCIRMLKKIARKSNHSTHNQSEIDAILRKALVWSKPASEFQYLFGGLQLFNLHASHSGLGFQLSLDLLSSNAVRRNQFRRDEPISWPLICGSDPYLSGALFIGEFGGVFYSQDVPCNGGVMISESIGPLLEAQAIYVECSTLLPNLSESIIPGARAASLCQEFAAAGLALTSLDKFCHFLVADNLTVLIRKVWTMSDEFQVGLFYNHASAVQEIAKIVEAYKTESTHRRFDRVNGWVGR